MSARPHCRPIAIVCEFGSVNGGEQSLLAALARLRDRFAPVFFAPAQGRLAERLRADAWPHRPFEVQDAAGRRRSTPALLDELAHLAKVSGVELLHANSLSMGRLTGQLSRRIPLPCTAHLRDIITLSPAAIGDLNGNACLFAVSAATRDFHVTQGLHSYRTRVLNNGVDLEAFRPPQSICERTRLRSEMQLPDDSQLAVTIGQIGLRKGLDVLAAAAPTLLRQCPRLHLVLVGERYSQKAESIAFEQQLKHDFRQAGRDGRVHSLGYQPAVATLLRAADLLIHPARQEPLGRVLLEAAATGLPIVATRVGGTPEMLSDGISARLIPPNDAESLVNAVTELVDYPDLAQQFGVAARRSMLERFDIRERAAELGNAWEEALQAASRQSSNI